MIKKEVFLTVFTSTYNRANTLIRLYYSLLKQTDKDFEWIIVDDGSTDNTQSMVDAWLKNDEKIKIRYFRKKNEGFHTGYNVAIANLNSELAVCIDSDDYMPADAVHKIHKCWINRGENEYGGIIGLDCLEDGRIIGGRLPDDRQSINLIDLLLDKYNVAHGDKKIVVRSDLYKKVAPMKVYPGEKYFNPHYMHLEISRNYDFLILNECLCIVEYRPDGMGANIFRQYKNSPNSFLEIRKQFFTFKGTSTYSKYRNSIHFVSSALLAHRFIEEYRRSDNKGIILLGFIPGTMLALLTMLKGN